MSVTRSMRFTIMLDQWSSSVWPSSLSAMRSTMRNRSDATSVALSDLEAGTFASAFFLGPLRPREGVTSSGSLRVTNAAICGVLEVDAVAGVRGALAGVPSFLGFFFCGVQSGGGGLTRVGQIYHLRCWLWNRSRFWNVRGVVVAGLTFATTSSFGSTTFRFFPRPFPFVLGVLRAARAQLDPERVLLQLFTAGLKSGSWSAAVSLSRSL